jgi:Flp pilus assembly protein TadD
VAKAVICAACGAKVRGDRERCPRCRERLVARPAAAAAPSNRWVTTGIVAGCVVLGGFTVVLWTSSRPAAPARTARAAAPARATTQRPAPAATDASDLVTVEAAPAVASSGLIGGERAYDNGNVDAALREFQAAVDANPNDPRALNNLGQMLVRVGRPQDAIPYFQQAVQMTPDSWAYQFNLARAHAQVKDWKAAIAGYQQASQLFPTDYATQFNLAKALQASGDVKGAVTAFEKAIELAPGEPDFQLSYGLALEAAARPQDAVAAYKKYLELEPSSPQAEKVKGHVTELEKPAGS